MPPLNVRFLDNKKFMWDGKVYEIEAEVRKIEEEYKKNKFEVSMIPEEGKYLLYTRRVVTEVAVEGQPH